MCSQYAVFPVDKRSKMSGLWKRQKRATEKQNVLKRKKEREKDMEKEKKVK